MTPEEKINNIVTVYIQKSKKRNTNDINRFISSLHNFTAEHKLLIVLLIFNGLSSI